MSLKIVRQTVDAIDLESVDILGLPVHRVDMPTTLEVLEGFIASREPHLVLTADASAFVMASQDNDLHTAWKVASLITPDSAGVVWAMRKRGVHQNGRVSGVEIVERLCELSADKGYRIYFLGAEPGIAQMAADRMILKYPGCNIVGHRHGYFPQESDDLVAEEIAAFKPDILAVAMGMPRQETFITNTMGTIGAPVAIGVGGTFDVLSGRTKRAPRLIQKIHMEWLWRLILNPKKIRKAAALPAFFFRVLSERR